MRVLFLDLYPTVGLRSLDYARDDVQYIQTCESPD